MRQALLELGPDLPFVGSHCVEREDAQSRVLICTFLPTSSLLRLARPLSWTELLSCCPLALLYSI